MTDAIVVSSVLAAETETDRVRAWAASDGATLAAGLVSNAIVKRAADAVNAQIKISGEEKPAFQPDVDAATSEVKILSNFLEVLTGLRNGKYNRKVQITIRPPT